MEWLLVAALSWPHPLPESLNARVLLQEWMMGGGRTWVLGLGSRPACIAGLGCDLEQVLSLAGPHCCLLSSQESAYRLRSDATF